jgi:hypothetical protein
MPRSAVITLVVVILAITAIVINSEYVLGQREDECHALGGQFTRGETQLCIKDGLIIRTWRP